MYRVLFATAVLLSIAILPSGAAEKWKIRGAYVGLSNDLSMLEAMAKNGMNSLITGGASHLCDFNEPEKVKERETLGERQISGLDTIQAATAKHGLKFWPGSELYGTGDRKRWSLDRTYVQRDGKHLPNTPCPLDPSFWQDKIGKTYRELAKWAVTKPNIPGIVMDAEMYGADRTAIGDACFCEPCKSEIAGDMGLSVNELDLAEDALVEQYREHSYRRTYDFLVAIRETVHGIWPACQFGGLIFDHVGHDGFVPSINKAFMMAWGTPGIPVLVFSEATYSTGFHAAHDRPGRPLIRTTGSFVAGKTSPFGVSDHPGYIDEWYERWAEWGAHAEMMGGLWIDRIPPENLAENLYHMAKRGRGYWLYDCLQLGDNPRTRLPGRGAPEYWEATALANRELDQWEASQGSYASSLRVRPFTLPAPGIDFSAWKNPALPMTGLPGTPATFYFRGVQQPFYIPAEAGDEVRLTLIADSAHPFKLKEDSAAVVVVDAEKNVIFKDKLTQQDFDRTPRDDRRYSGSKAISFRAPETGTYVLYLSGKRHAYAIGESSHAWITSLEEGMIMFQPKEWYFQASGEEMEVRYRFGTPVVASAEDEEGRPLDVRVEKYAEGEHDVHISLLKPGVQIVKMTLTEKPTLIVLKAHKGLRPWFASSSQAPFPE
jgi:hypothetical protein